MPHHSCYGGHSGQGPEVLLHLNPGEPVSPFGLTQGIDQQDQLNNWAAAVELESIKDAE